MVRKREGREGMGEVKDGKKEGWSPWEDVGTCALMENAISWHLNEMRPFFGGKTQHDSDV